MNTNVLFKAGLIVASVATSSCCYAESVDSSDFFSLNADELNGGTKSSVIANISISNTTSLDTDTNAPPYIIGEDHVGGDWRNITAPYNCQEWMPHSDTVGFGAPFKQVQECDVTRERDIQVYNIWSNGNRTLKYQYKDEQSDGVITERQAIGTKHYITGQSVTYSPWSNSGSPYSCSSWSPSVNTIDLGKKFTQTRSCQQKQIQYKKTLNDWTDGRFDLAKSETLTNTINNNQSRSATGTKDVVATGVWVRNSLDKHRGSGKAINGGSCAKIGATELGWSGEAGQVAGSALAYRYTCK